MSERQQGVVKSADRVLDLFELLARWDRGMSHTEMYEALGIPKSSLTQLLKNLMTREYVALAATQKRYVLGPRFSMLAKQAALTSDLPLLAGPLLAELTDKTGESSALNIVEDGMLKVIATVSSSKRLVSHMRLEDLAPMHATSGGKAILAHLSDARLEEHVARYGLERATANTVTDARTLRGMLAQVKIDGYAASHEEFTIGIVGLAVPVLTPDREPLAAINVAVPAARYSDEARPAILQALRNCAAVLEHRLFPKPDARATA